MRKERIRKLAPPRPFPTVPTSVSASGPKSAHKEGKNLICITRQTPLAAYLTRCKKLLVEQGYDTLHLHAMGAAIPHLLTLAVSLPSILPFPKEDVKTEVRTGTIEVVDEIIPDDEDEDISTRTRGKGGVSIILKVNKGEGLLAVPVQPNDNKSKRKPIPNKSRKPASITVYEEQDDN
ncbi:hypothetical protein BU17DRAFT_47030 [Hysterangium stoloniferum]|nr:hypothetical protein BU17DRAFT_47030 [Hysterangium stoloniferum]